MLRRIIGWKRFEDEDWHTTGHRMKLKLERALLKYPVISWSERRNTMKNKLLKRIEDQVVPSITHAAHMWAPTQCADKHLNFEPHRPRGRPRTHWYE